MTVEQAARILREMYDAGKHRGKQAAAIHLFGIKYANELRHLSIKDILVQADMPGSYHTEVSKGRKLAEYVEVVKNFP